MRATGLHKIVIGSPVVRSGLSLDLSPGEILSSPPHSRVLHQVEPLIQIGGAWLKRRVDTERRRRTYRISHTMRRKIDVEAARRRWKRRLARPAATCVQRQHTSHEYRSCEHMTPQRIQPCTTTREGQPLIHRRLSDSADTSHLPIVPGSPVSRPAPLTSRRSRRQRGEMDRPADPSEVSHGR